MKKVKFIWTLMCISILAIGCQSAANNEEKEDPGAEAFKRNSQTVLEYLEAWQNESVDYDKFYAEDYAAWGTGFGDLDTMRFDQLKEWDERMFETFDFKIVNQPINLLPGVNVETKKIDGSVRHYSEWEITLSATDSTDAKTGNLRMYQALVFNEEGKIIMDLTYGDFGGLMSYLYSKD